MSLTQYVARHGLSTVQKELLPMVHGKAISVRTVKAKDANYKRLRQNGVHKGEAETIAWLLSIERKAERPLFVTRDAGAAAAARSEGLRNTDVMGVVVDMLAVGALLEDDARIALAIWDDKTRQNCRPADWSGFAETLRRRKERGFPYS